MGGVYQAMLMLWGSKQSLSRGIRESKMDISRVGKCRLCRLGAVLGRKIRVDSKTQDPGELCQTRLQDTDTLSQTKQSCSYTLFHILAYFWEEDESVHKTKCRKGKSNSKGQNLHCFWVVRSCICVHTWRTWNMLAASAGFCTVFSHFYWNDNNLWTPLYISKKRAFLEDQPGTDEALIQIHYEHYNCI